MFFGPGCSHLLASRPGLASDSRLSVETIPFADRTFEISTSQRNHTVSSEIRHSKRKICNRCPELAVYGRKFSCIFSLLLSRPPQNFEWLISDDTILPMDLFYNYVFRAVAWPRDIDFTQAFPPSEFQNCFKSLHF
jgi:hypothetical protein